MRSPDVLRIAPYLLVTLAMAGCSVLPVHAGTVPRTAQPRKARTFARQYESMIEKLPSRVRIEVAGGSQKVYVKDGGR